MKKFYLLPAIAAVIFITAGCAAPSISITKINKGSNQAGIRFYHPNPYIVSADKDGNCVNQIIYLPDFSHGYILNIKPGTGSATISGVTLENGWNLTSIGGTLDSKTADNINAVAGAISGVISTFAKIYPFASMAKPPSLSTVACKQGKVFLYKLNYNNDNRVLENIKPVPVKH